MQDSSSTITTHTSKNKMRQATLYQIKTFGKQSSRLGRHSERLMGKIRSIYLAKYLNQHNPENHRPLRSKTLLARDRETLTTSATAQFVHTTTALMRRSRNTKQQYVLGTIQKNASHLTTKLRGQEDQLSIIECRHRKPTASQSRFTQYTTAPGARRDINKPTRPINRCLVVRLFKYAFSSGMSQISPSSFSSSSFDLLGLSPAKPLATASVP